MIQIPYYKGTIPLTVPESQLTATLCCAISSYTVNIPESELVRRAIQNPIGSPALRDIVRGKRSILIVTSDHTRPVPSRITLPVLTEEILKAEPSAEITILIATGLHRATTREEMEAKFSADMVERFPFVVHDAYRLKDLRFVKTLPSGADFWVNRLALETDVLITEGFIEPHFFAGFSGGRKSILPGIAGAVSIMENHSASAVAHPDARGGILKGNPIHADMLDAARAVNVAFTLNVALNGEKRIIGAFAGDLEKAHEAGCEFVSHLSYAAPVMGDIVITSNGGYPLDQNLYQCPKSVSTAVECAKPGAILIVAASCVDGIGGDQFEKLMTMGTPEEILSFLMKIPAKETLPEQWCAQVFARIMMKHEIIIVSDNLDPDQARRANFTPASTMDEALAIAMARKGSAAKIVVIPDGISVIAAGGKREEDS